MYAVLYCISKQTGIKMKVVEIALHRSVNTFTGETWNKVVMKAEVRENEEPDEVFSAMLHKVKEYEAQAAANVPTDPPLEVQKSRPKDTIAALKNDIKSCTTLKVLQSYQLLVKNNVELQSIYHQKEKELTA